MATTDWTQAPSLNNTTGLINTPDVTQANATQSGAIPTTEAAQTQANVQTVAPDQTVSGQLDAMLKADSPYIQRAQAKAAEQSNARGLLNSSMAAGAGTAAAIDAAAPIAQANAGLFADARNRNQDALNSTGQFNASSANQFRLADKNIQASKDAAATAQQYTQANMGLQQQFDLGKMDKSAAITLSQMSAQQQNDLQKMATAQGYDLTKMNAQQINDLAKASVLQGYDLQKMDVQAANTLKQMDAASVLDLKKLATAQGYNIETMNAQQIMDLQKMASANQFDLQKMAAANGYTIEQQNNLSKEQLVQLAAQNGYDLAKMARQQGYNLETMNVQQINDLAKMDKTFTQADREAQAKFGYDSALMAMQQTAAKDIAGIEATYKNLTQTSSSAASIVNNASLMVNQILLSDLDATAMQDAIDQIKGNMQNSLELIGTLGSNLDLSAYFG